MEFWQDVLLAGLLFGTSLLGLAAHHYAAELRDMLSCTVIQLRWRR